jgi:hypothetical protein
VGFLRGSNSEKSQRDTLWDSKSRYSRGFFLFPGFFWLKTPGKALKNVGNSQKERGFRSARDKKVLGVVFES